MFGLTVKQIIIAATGFVIAVLEIFLLKDSMDMNLMMTIVFITLILFIGFGIVNIQGVSLFKFVALAFKGVDKRPYNSKGVFDDYEENNE